MGEEESLDGLRQDYCPPLDEAVFYAIASDYDLKQPNDVQSLRVTLEPLRASAVEQENADFDPSGTGGLHHTQVGSEDQVQTVGSSPDETSTSNGVRSITTGVSELPWDDETSYGDELEAMSDEGKKKWLQNTFTEIPPFQVAYTLKKCNGQVNKALDELLTLNTLEEAKEQGDYLGRVPKGIDGFMAEENGNRARKRKTRKSRTTDSSRASSAMSVMSEAPTGRRNVWTAAEEDVEFLISRTNIPPAKCRAAYHANHASLSATVHALAGQHTDEFKTLNEIDPLVQLSLVDLQKDFPSVPQAEVYGVLTLARNMPPAARELIQNLMSSPARNETVNLSGAVTYAPLELASDFNPSTSTSTSSWAAVDPMYARKAAAAHGVAAGIAFSQASAAYRRGKSDHLMGGAAAYYSEVGRERALAAKASSAQAAAALVGSQSSATVLDLHGISVVDAVRIASDRVDAWWSGLGDAKYALGGGGPARAGFRVVYGVGRHSRDGAPRLGPAVSRMLIREGWRLEVGHGESIVYGKARR